jgi:hypothetical protein
VASIFARLLTLLRMNIIFLILLKTIPKHGRVLFRGIFLHIHGETGENHRSLINSRSPTRIRTSHLLNKNEALYCLTKPVSVQLILRPSL